jgi:hypothetical protein
MNRHKILAEKLGFLNFSLLLRTLVNLYPPLVVFSFWPPGIALESLLRGGKRLIHKAQQIGFTPSETRIKGERPQPYQYSLVQFSVILQSLEATWQT